MKELKSISEIQDYISDLERKNVALQNTHAYRVGMAIMKFYDQPTGLSKIFGLRKFVTEVLAGTKKVHPIDKYSDVKILLTKEKVNTVQFKKIVNVTNVPPNQYYFIPQFKTQQIVVATNTVKMSMDKKYFLLTPNNYHNLISFVNADIIEINTDDLLNKACWRGFGTYDDIQRTNEVLDLLTQNKRIKKVLIDNNNLILFPLLLDRINIFDHVLVLGENDEI